MKGPCPVCPSSDGLHTYPTGAAHCFVCGYHSFVADGTEGIRTKTIKVTKMEQPGFVTAIKDRAISLDACKKYGVTTMAKSDGATTASHYYPYYNTKTGEATAAKKRICSTKDFRWSGDRTDIGLFGQQTCRGSGKFLTIVEGEADCLAVSDMFNNKFDVVSLKDGAASAVNDVKENLEFIDGYDAVVWCMDADDAGRAATEQVKDLLSPGRLKILQLQEYKDPNEYLMNRSVALFTKAWWDAKPYTPVGIVHASDTWDAVLEYKHTPMTPYPWAGLNDILLGQRTKEVVVWAAETGVGKSQTMRELIHHNISSTDEKVGCLMLEESTAKSMLGWMSFHAGRPLHKDLANIPDAELRGYWEKACAGDRFVLLDHKGWKNDMSVLKSRVRYMAKALGCTKIILDHLHIALSSVSGASGDWSGIDELVTELAALALECNVCLHLVSHVSEGRALRGSKGIAKVVDAVIYLERDKHHENPDVANTTMVVVDKNRFSGDVGTACYLKYDKTTGRMNECAKPIGANVPEEF